MRNVAEWFGVLIEVGLVLLLGWSLPPFTPAAEFHLAPVVVLSTLLSAMVFLLHGSKRGQDAGQR